MVVFVLGAGASVPYGYPTGYGLREHLIEIPNTIFNNSSIDQQLYYLLNNRKPANVIAEFKSVFYNCGVNSIDLFLTNNESFDKIGKVLIAYILTQCEYISRVKDLGKQENQNWMQYFYNIFISRAVGKDGLDLLINKPFNMAFITFNYDRSLEYFFESSIYSLYYDHFQKHPDDFLKIKEKIIIHHMYGSINKPDISYGMLAGEKALELSKHINIIHDENRKESSKKSNELLEQAEKIVFLGFGYDEYNISNLLNDKPLSGNKKIIGSVYRMSDSEINIKDELLTTHFGGNYYLYPDNKDLGNKDFFLENLPDIFLFYKTYKKVK